MPPHDESLLRQVKDSSIEAFETLFRIYHPILFRQVWFKARNGDLAEDIVQETFVRVWQKRESLKPGKSFLALLVSISANLLKDHFKHEQVKTRNKDAIPPPARMEGDDPEEAVHLSLLQSEIHDAANRFLPDRCRTIFVLSRIEDKSNEEIAELLKVSRKTVENQLNHALNVLRKKLAPLLSKVNQ